MTGSAVLTDAMWARIERPPTAVMHVLRETFCDPRRVHAGTTVRNAV